MGKGKTFLLSIIVVVISFSGRVAAQASIDSFLELDLEDLLSMEVTSVSKKKQKLTTAAAAIFVITQEDIQRSGVTSIPEALRMAPGLQVAKIDANKWAISSRGFNSQFANKLLVLIDGRSVYTPTYSGVYWDVQDTVLDDIDRIEVIRGPGATLWGANAVNGVINIITKNAQDTQGGLFVAGVGNEEEGFASLRYGAQLDDELSTRGYLKFNRRDASYDTVIDEDAGDDWQNISAGFRIDHGSEGASRWTIHGDVYEVDANQILSTVFFDPSDPANLPPYAEFNVPDEILSTGYNLLAKSEWVLSPQSSVSLQAYLDHTERLELAIDQTNDTFDIDFQHQYGGIEGHDIVWGLGYRRIEDQFDNSYRISITPDSQTVELVNLFVQDDIELVPEKLRLTVGSKYEHNDYTGAEVQPNIRLLWLPKPGHTLWASVARAVRTPSRVEQDTNIVTAVVPGVTPIVISLEGNDDFLSEELLAIELGYRSQPTESMSLDLALFQNDYSNLSSFEAASATRLVFDNKVDATSSGIEMVLDWRLKEWWKLQTAYTYITLSAKTDGDSTDTITVAGIEDSSPQNQLSIRSAMDISADFSVDLWLYFVDEITLASATVTEEIPGYTSLNARLNWRLAKDLEFSLAGQNLTNDRHREFLGSGFTNLTEVERSVYAQFRMQF